MTSKQLQEIADSYRRLGGIEALEQIKTEIEDRYHKEMIKRHANNGYDYQDLLLVGIDIGKNIVGKRIAELKGENE